MEKPATLDGYNDQYTVECERVLVTLLRGLGPWKESVFLVGGLTPRYLVAARPPEVPAHAGTLDVDIVIDLQILADTAGYRTLEENLRAMNFERSTNERGQRLSWRWQTRTETGALMVVELLADAPEIAAGWPTTGRRRTAAARALCETFVDEGPFRASCYRAANWLRIGETSGGKGKSRKGVYVLPLSENCREILRGDRPEEKAARPKTAAEKGRSSRADRRFCSRWQSIVDAAVAVAARDRTIFLS